jgi:predicted Rossmann fold flavoprotein
VQVVDVAIVGAGAAGLMAGIFAKRTAPNQQIVLLDSAKKIGAKILVAGGGRCNVTHEVVDEHAYAGSSRNAIKKVLRRFDVPQTIAFFETLGVKLKREDTGKLFPVTDDAHTVLNALTSALDAPILHQHRVDSVQKQADGFMVRGEWGELFAKRVILATGGRSLPKSGSDGHGYVLAKALGHTVTRYITPALVPLTLPSDHFIVSLSGLTVPTTLTLHDHNGKKHQAFTNSMLCTHFGLSGPGVLDISRYWIDLQHTDPKAHLRINWLPDMSAETLDAQLQQPHAQSIGRYLGQWLPERLARTLCTEAQLDFTLAIQRLTREQRRALVRMVTDYSLPISGNRGYTYAEVTAGGVPLSEIVLERMASRVCEGLHLCGELCDVDGRIGGFNFQWAWASGYVAGISAVS